MNPQEFINEYTALKEQIKAAYERQDVLLTAFIAEHGLDTAHKITDPKDGKERYLRAVESKGRFVPNKLYDIGLTIKKPSESK